MSTCGLLLAHLAKSNVSFCHHLASVVRRLDIAEKLVKQQMPIL
jgi:hypothetical protein